MPKEKTLAEKKWQRGLVQKRCLYCKEPFFQQTPWQDYCCASHRVMASRERLLSQTAKEERQNAHGRKAVGR